MKTVKFIIIFICIVFLNTGTPDVLTLMTDEKVDCEFLDYEQNKCMFSIEGKLKQFRRGNVKSVIFGKDNDFYVIRENGTVSKRVLLSLINDVLITDMAEKIKLNEIKSLKRIYGKLKIENAALNNNPSRVKVFALNVRSKPDIKSDVLFIVYKDNIVNILSEEKEWFKISNSAGYQGYVYGDYIEKRSMKPQIKKLPMVKIKPPSISVAEKFKTGIYCIVQGMRPELAGLSNFLHVRGYNSYLILNGNTNYLYIGPFQYLFSIKKIMQNYLLPLKNIKFNFDIKNVAEIGYNNQIIKSYDYNVKYGNTRQLSDEIIEFDDIYASYGLDKNSFKGLWESNYKGKEIVWQGIIIKVFRTADTEIYSEIKKVYVDISDQQDSFDAVLVFNEPLDSTLMNRNDLIVFKGILGSYVINKGNLIIGIGIKDFDVAKPTE